MNQHLTHGAEEFLTFAYRLPQVLRDIPFAWSGRGCDVWNSAVKIEVLQTGLANSVRFCVCQERFFDGFVDLASISSFVVFLIFRETVLLCRREDKTLPSGFWCAVCGFLSARYQNELAGVDTELLAERFYYQALSVAPQIGEWVTMSF